MENKVVWDEDFVEEVNFEGWDEEDENVSELIFDGQEGHFDFRPFSCKYGVFDIVSYEDLFDSLGNGYGSPGCVEIATLDKTGWYPAGFCSRVSGLPEDGIWDCDETQIFRMEEYGKTWVAIASMGKTEGWNAAAVGRSYLLDVGADKPESRTVYPIRTKDFVGIEIEDLPF